MLVFGDLKRVSFGGNLVRHARFGDLTRDFWRKSRTKCLFCRLDAWLLEDVSYETLVLQASSVSFWGSLVRNAHFGDLHLTSYFWKSRAKRAFWRLALDEIFLEVSCEARRFWRLDVWTFGGSLVRSARFVDLKYNSVRAERVSFESVPQGWHTRVSRKSVLPGSPTRVFHKSAPQECPTRVVSQERRATVSYKSVLQECPTRVFRKSECHTRVPHKSDQQECPTSVPRACPTRVSYKSAPQKCPPNGVLQGSRKRGPHKSVPQESPTRVSHRRVSARVTYKTVPQEFHTRLIRKSVPQECEWQTRVSRKSVPTRVSHKNVLQDCPTRVPRPHKNVLQECPTKVFLARVSKIVWEFVFRVRVCIRVRGFHLGVCFFNISFRSEFQQPSKASEEVRQGS